MMNDGLLEGANVGNVTTGGSAREQVRCRSNHDARAVRVQGAQTVGVNYECLENN